jgi:hypothetical protein
MKSKRIKWARQLACIEELRNANKFDAENLKASDRF